MGCEVYANNSEIACKAGDGKVIAAFPDVCLSPPSPPAGPVPVPYPDTSFSKDMQNGSKTVMIKGQEVMLKDQSFYKTSPLGDEAATNGLGAGVVTHVITGKTFFTMWSMDVQFEGQNVDRHLDITTSNHASPPPNEGVPMPNMAMMAVAAVAAPPQKPKCKCCGKDEHSSGKAMSMDEWYTSDKSGNPLPANHPNVVAYKDLMNDVQNRSTSIPRCTCNKPVTPSPPCNVFYKPTTKAERDAIKTAWNAERPAYQVAHNVPTVAQAQVSLTSKLQRPPTPAEINAERRVNHLTPKAAGGCPTGEGNLQPNGELCAVCRSLDDRFGKLQDLAVK